MPLTKGVMPNWQKSKITRNFRFLKKNIDAKYLQDYFIEKGIFEFEDLDKINGYNPNTVENRNNAFFQLLFNAGPTAYGVFLEALRQVNSGYVADKIEGSEVQQEQQDEVDEDGDYGEDHDGDGDALFDGYGHFDALNLIDDSDTFDAYNDDKDGSLDGSSGDDDDMP